MANQRPDPKILKRKLLDIKLRYDAKSRDVSHTNRSRGMAAIRLSELTRWLDDAYGAGVELDATDASYLIVRIFSHHMGALRDTPRRITSWVATYAPWISPRDLERLINEVTDCPLKWTADKLGWKIKLTDAKRTELKIKTIGAIDCNKDQRKARDKAKRAERERQRRARNRSTVPCI
jgi:hypothetical protein